MRRLLIAFFAVLVVATTPAEAAFVRYAAAEGEYSLLLPEAPQAETIRSNGKDLVPLLPFPQPVGVAGERATFKRTDSETGDSIEVTVTTMKARAEFLDTLNETNITLELEKMYSAPPLDRVKTSFSAGSQTLKWGTISGYRTSQDNRLYYEIAHYLVGLESITLVQINFSVENRRYKRYYADIGKSIAYTGN